MIPYRKRIQVQDNPKQATLDPTSPKGCKPKQKPRTLQTYTITTPVLCPFCLHIGKINEFLISTKKGYHRNLGQCPECNNKMRLSTLTAEWTPEQFAEFAYNYATSGYWQKVPFKKFNNRLYKIGWAKKFWDRYKQLKGEDTQETYEEWLLRKQMEAQYDT